MNLLGLSLILWAGGQCVAKIESNWDDSLNENEIYYAENNIDFDGNEVDWNELEMNGTSRTLPAWFVIFPGTKWCGSGNISNDFDDLGQFAETDKCCRSHDYCDDVILGYQEKHNLTNPAFYSRLNCECDEEFRRCLRTVNSAVSTKIGFIYFNVLGTQCFREDYPATCERHSFVPVRKCVEYTFDTSQEKAYQWFDVPRF